MMVSALGSKYHDLTLKDQSPHGRQLEVQAGSYDVNFH
jgi:hypothetical protein